jgi:anaerobic dimethyl sulfoxide reductase subunit B (iron-sulfur subunit)
MATQIGFYQDCDVCIGCRACIISCKDKNDLPVGEKIRRVYDYAGGTWDIAENMSAKPKDWFAYSVSIACNHCAAPACIAVCPVDAIQKREDGIVWIDAEICIGCEACITACPYEAPYMSKEQGVARKCDFCKDLIDEGTMPYCVAACPARAINYGELESLESMHPDALQTVPPITDTVSTGPSILFNPSRLNPTGALPGVTLNEPEELVSEAV